MTNKNFESRTTQPIVRSYDSGYEHSFEHYSAVKGIVEQAESARAAVCGVYRNLVALNSAADSLRDHGFPNTQISVLFPESALFPKKEGTGNLASEKHTKAPHEGTGDKGTAPTAKSDAVGGGSLGWLTEIGTVDASGIGRLIAAGPILAHLTMAGAGGVLDGLAGALFGVGIPESDAKRYEERVKEGAVLLSVHVDSSEWIARAKQVLERTGAYHVSSTEAESAGRHRPNQSLPRAS